MPTDYVSRWHKWCLIGIVLLSGHAASAWYYAERFAAGSIGAAAKPLTLDMAPNEWATATEGADSTSYLRCAEQVAAGRGIMIEVPNSHPRRIAPFAYWGPGTPWVLGHWQRLVGGRSMWTFFALAVVAQLLFGALALATASLGTRNTLALAAVALASGVCPPLQDWFYGPQLTSSEIVSLPLWALIFYVLSRGLLAYRATNWAAQLGWPVWRWFALAGVLIGLESLVRDSAEVYAVFVAVFLVGRALMLDRRRLVLALTAAAVLVGATVVVRRPVRRWNELRVGQKVVATSTAGSIWRVGLWLRHDACPFYEQVGLGFGQYLDPEAPARVEQYYASNRPSPELYSLGQLLQAIGKRPLDALAFKAAYLPRLWLDADAWPETLLGLKSWWCLAFYAALAVYCVVQWRRRQVVPEVIYLYMILLVAASPLIHFEFRYTIPVWNTLVIVPGLLIDAFTEARRARSSARLAAEAQGLGSSTTSGGAETRFPLRAA